MSKIKMIANKDTNFIFHMMSVAKCGYDNEYGEHYRTLYSAEDLAILKKYENMITVCGGEHCGDLYGLLVGQPACANIPANEYYSGLIHMIQNGEVPEEGKVYIDVVSDIASIMIKYYDYYCTNIWKQEKEKILSFIDKVLLLFESSDFTKKAEEFVGRISFLKPLLTRE